MNKIIVSKFEYDLLISLLEELYKNSSDETVSQELMDELGETRRLFELEMAYYNIRNDKQNPTKKQMVKWILTKIKTKKLDL